MEYADYLKTDHWRRTRKRKLHQVDYECEHCGDAAQEVHHNSYANLFNEAMNELTALCSGCHRAIHQTDLNGKLKVLFPEW